MIAFLRGVVRRVNVDAVVVDVGGVGYKVEAPTRTLQQLPPIGEEVELFTHTYVREDSIRLFGFDSADGLQLFERLITVSGVGPKLALAGLGQMSAAALQKAIVTGDVAKLSSISGVGKRTAERMIVDLGQSIGALDLGADLGDHRVPAAQSAVSQLEEALLYLGYKDREIKQAVRRLGSSINDETPLEDLLKAALKVLK